MFPFYRNCTVIVIYMTDHIDVVSCTRSRTFALPFAEPFLPLVRVKLRRLSVHTTKQFTFKVSVPLTIVIKPPWGAK